jgi:hypothetical protein
VTDSDVFSLELTQTVTSARAAPEVRSVYNESAEGLGYTLRTLNQFRTVLGEQVGVSTLKNSPQISVKMHQNEWLNGCQTVWLHLDETVITQNLETCEL